MNVGGVTMMSIDSWEGLAGNLKETGQRCLVRDFRIQIQTGSMKYSVFRCWPWNMLPATSTTSQLVL